MPPNPLRKIIIVSEFVNKDSNSTGYYWEHITNIYAQHGCEVSVISTPHSNASARQDNDLVQRYSIGYSGAYNKSNLLLRIVGQLRLSLAFAFKTAQIAEPRHILICGTNPPLMLAMIVILRAMKKFRWVLLVHDVFPENLVPAGILSPTSSILKILNTVFTKVLRRADFVIAIGRDMAEILTRKGVSDSRIRYIPNFVHVPELDSSIECHRSASKPDLCENEVTFCFFGNLGRVQGIHILLNACAKVKSQYARFLFIGDGANAHLVDEYAANDTRYRREEAIPFALHVAGLLQGDVAIVTLAPGMFGLGVPSKAYFSLASGKPILVIGDKGAELHQMLQDHPEAGWFCQAGDVDAIANTMNLICSELSLRDPDAPKSLLSNEYSYEFARETYVQLIDELSDNPASASSKY